MVALLSGCGDVRQIGVRESALQFEPKVRYSKEVIAMAIAEEEWSTHGSGGHNRVYHLCHRWLELIRVLPVSGSYGLHL